MIHDYKAAKTKNFIRHFHVINLTDNARCDANSSLCHRHWWIRSSPFVFATWLHPKTLHANVPVWWTFRKWCFTAISLSNATSQIKHKLVRVTFFRIASIVRFSMSSRTLSGCIKWMNEHKKWKRKKTESNKFQNIFYKNSTIDENALQLRWTSLYLNGNHTVTVRVRCGISV